MAVLEREVLVEALREALLGAIEQKLEQHKAELLLALQGKALSRGNLQLEENIFAGEIGQVSASLGRSTASWFDQSRTPAAEKIGKRVWDEPHREDAHSEEHLAILPLPQSISVQPPDEDVPGLIPKAISKSACSEIPAGASPTVHSVQVVSQTQILGTDVRENCTGTDCSSSAFKEEGASGILLRWAFLLKTLILSLFLSELVLAILVHQYGHVHGVAWDFTAVSLTVYFMVGYGGVELLARALASEELNLVALKLQLHYSDERRTELLRRERWKYAFAWFAFMASVVVHQGFEVWNIQRGVLDDTIVRIEDLPFAKVCAQVNEAITIISFAFVSAVILLTCYIQSVLLLAVDGALDDWCLEVYDSQDYEVGVKTWNRMQALLKCLGRELETSTILLQAFGGIGFVAYSASAVSVVIQASFESLSLSMIAGAGAPAIFLLMIAIRLGAQAAALTEKCRVLPAFVNTIPGACIDLHRQYLVKFIVDTSTGFIVKGVTLTQAMFLRQLYLLATVLTGLLGIFIRLYL